MISGNLKMSSYWLTILIVIECEVILSGGRYYESKPPRIFLSAHGALLNSPISSVQDAVPTRVIHPSTQQVITIRRCNLSFNFVASQQLKPENLLF